jgi:hypothetical protein
MPGPAKTLTKINILGKRTSTTKAADKAVRAADKKAFKLLDKTLSHRIAPQARFCPAVEPAYPAGCKPWQIRA